VNRAQLEHVIRAAADVAGDPEIVIVGSQAILGEFPDAPEPLLVSQEADVYPRNRPEKAIVIDGALGDGSQFHETFGYYAHGVGPETAKAPTGWEARAVAIRLSPAPHQTSEVIGWCMERHDVVLAKCVAGRPRDWEYAEEAMRHEIVDPDELQRRVSELPVSKAERARVARTLAGVIERAPRTR